LEIDESKLWHCEKKGYPDEYLAWDKDVPKPVIFEHPDGKKEIMTEQKANEVAKDYIAKVDN